MGTREAEIFAGFCCGGILGLFVAGGLTTGVWIERDKALKKQALDRGYAEFKSDKDGNAVFTWREPNEKQD